MHSSLIAHWPLAGHEHELQQNLDGIARNITWVEGPRGGAQTAALFNGRDSVISVPDSPQLQLGCDEFSLSVWLKCARPMRGAFGDVLSKFDAERRCGLNLTVSGGSTCYGSNSDARHVHAGIDDGYLGAWSDHGRPGIGNPLVSCLTVFEGELYAGLSDAQSREEACKVFRWDGTNGWIDCGRVGDELNCPSVMSMLVHDGHLYAGTGAWDWGRAEAARDADPPQPLTRVYRYEGGTQWRDLGAVGHGQRVLCLASFEGELYAGLDKGGKGECYKLQGDQWVHVGGTDNGDNFECLMPVGGVLYGASHWAIYRYQGGKSWKTIGFQPFDITQIHAFQVLDNKLWIGTWPQGYVLRLEDDGQWTNTGKMGLDVGAPGVAPINEINSLGVHNGKLYAGVLPKAQVYRYESDGHWTLLSSLASTPDWNPEKLPSWMRVLSLSTHRGRLFACTGTCMARHQDLDLDLTAGRVLSCDAGIVASHEHDLGSAWTHVTMVRRRTALELYVNGALAQSTPMPAGQHFHLGNAAPLRIGAGEQSSFDGALSDLRLYGAALRADQVAQLAAL